jgi:hypothetical protein
MVEGKLAILKTLHSDADGYYIYSDESVPLGTPEPVFYDALDVWHSLHPSTP